MNWEQQCLHKWWAKSRNRLSREFGEYNHSGIYSSHFGGCKWLKIQNRQTINCTIVKNQHLPYIHCPPLDCVKQLPWSPSHTSYAELHRPKPIAHLKHVYANKQLNASSLEQNKQSYLIKHNKKKLEIKQSCFGLKFCRLKAFKYILNTCQNFTLMQEGKVVKWSISRLHWSVP